MNKLENYLDKQQFIYKDLKYSDYDYTDEEIFNDDLTFLLEHVYNIKVFESKRKRIKQFEWANNIKEKFNNKCVISGVSESYLEACHLVEVKDDENYDLDNGIVLTKNLHTQFDNGEFKINPETYCIELKDNVSGDILKYNRIKLDLPKTYKFKKYLEQRYNKT